MFLVNKTSIFLMLNFLTFFNVYASPLTDKVQEIKTASYKTAPNLKANEAKYNESVANQYSMVKNHTPNLLFNIKKQKNFYESQSALVKQLGLTTPKYSWGIDYQWSLFNYGNILYTQKTINQKNIDQIDYSNSKSQYDVEFNTAVLNYLLVKYKQAAILNSLKKAETAKKEANLGFQLGQKTKIDVLRAEANFISLDSKKLGLIDEEKSLKSKFEELTGLESQFLNSFTEYSEDQLFMAISELANANKKSGNLLFTESPIIKKHQLEINGSVLEAKSITKDEWPDLKLTGSYDNSGDEISKTFHSPSRSHTVALVLSIPLFTGGSIISDNFERFYAQKRIQYLASQKQLEIENNLKNTELKIETMKTLVESLKINVDQFEELYKLTSKSYQLGKSTLFELLEVQDNLLESKINLATNKIQLYQLIENYNWQSGI